MQRLRTGPLSLRLALACLATAGSARAGLTAQAMPRAASADATGRPAPAAADEVDRLLEQGRHAAAAALLEGKLKQGDAPSAEPGLRRLVAARPEVARYRYLLAFACIQRFRHAEAIPLLEQAIAAEPTRHG